MGETNFEGRTPDDSFLQGVGSVEIELPSGFCFEIDTMDYIPEDDEVETEVFTDGTGLIAQGEVVGFMLGRDGTARAIVSDTDPREGGEFRWRLPAR